MQKFSDYLKKIRKDLNLSQKQLADKLEYDRTVISRWESGERIPDIEMYEMICKKLNISPITYFEEKKQKKIKVIVVILLIVCFIFTVIVLNLINNKESYMYELSSAKDKISVQGNFFITQEKDFIYMKQIDLDKSMNTKVYDIEYSLFYDSKLLLQIGNISNKTEALNKELTELNDLVSKEVSFELEKEITNAFEDKEIKVVIKYLDEQKNTHILEIPLTCKSLD